MNKYLILTIQIFVVSSVLAQLSPGDLSEPHSHLEGLKNCTKCHEIGEKVVPANCLDCHVLLKKRIQDGLGLHARNEYKNCVECHSDHQGEEFNLIWWKEGKEKFDHSKTGYPLEGKHLGLDCRRCHTSANIKDKQKLSSKNKNLNKTYLGLESECINCHRDEHRGQLDIQCLKCHDLNAWKPAPKFDHNQARFSLIGKHLTVDCILCHKKSEDRSSDYDQDYMRFSGLKFSKCSDCHRDPHKGRLGATCNKCHTLSGWKNVVNQDFNHDQTRFPLIGKHRGITCEKCHRSNQSLKDLKFSQCRNCHVDFHQGQFYHRPQKGACEECHTVDGFLPATFTVDLHNKGSYPLEGAHLAVPCNFCHPQKRNNTIQFRFSSTACLTCHQDPHNKESEQYLESRNIPKENNVCQYCHTVNSWGSIEFDHTQTNFQLDGKHQSIECKLCHKDEGINPDISIVLKLNKNKCQECHQDIHLGQFSSHGVTNSNDVITILCDNCHTTKDWVASKFDHNRDSNFKLEGAHNKLNCLDCHKTANKNGVDYIHYKPLKSSCSACHVKRSMVQ